MPTSSMQRGKKRNECRLLPLALACGVLLLAHIASAQIYLPKPAPEPSEYGKVILDNYSGAEPGAVVFDHWLHRSKFTCRVCHVDVGFAMKAKATGINAKTNHEGFHCGACHDGTRVFEGKTIFAACPDAAVGTAHGQQCDRCHSLGKKGVRKHEYKEFVAKFPKGIYGVNWEAAEKSGAIKPIDFVEGLSVKKVQMQNRKDFSVEAAMPWVEPIEFSHEKHSIWNGCELCHPEIFPTAQKGAIHFSMFANIEGRYCGACHGKVAFPLNNCKACHSGAPLWAP
jgi:c(7)-type cytochrome triheme protein